MAISIHTPVRTECSVSIFGEAAHVSLKITTSRIMLTVAFNKTCRRDVRYDPVRIACSLLRVQKAPFQFLLRELMTNALTTITTDAGTLAEPIRSPVLFTLLSSRLTFRLFNDSVDFLI